MAPYAPNVRERMRQGWNPDTQPATAPRARGAAPGLVGGEQPGVQASPSLPATPFRGKQALGYRRYRELAEDRDRAGDLERAKRNLGAGPWRVPASQSAELWPEGHADRQGLRPLEMRAYEQTLPESVMGLVKQVVGGVTRGLIHEPIRAARDVQHAFSELQGRDPGGLVLDRDPDTPKDRWLPRARWLQGEEFYGKDGRGGVSTIAETLIPLPEKSETVLGGLAGGVSQFLALFYPMGKIRALKGLGEVTTQVGKRVFKSGQWASVGVRGYVSDFAGFDADDPFVGDAVHALVQTHPDLKSPILDLIEEYSFSTDPDDSRIKKRFMRGIEGFAIGESANALFLTLRGAYRGAAGATRRAHTRHLLAREGIDPNAPVTAKDTAVHEELDKLEAERAADKAEPEAKGTPLDQLEERLRAASERDPRAARREGRTRTIQAIMDKFGVSQAEADDWYSSKLQERMLPKLMAHEADATADDLLRELDQWEDELGGYLDEIRFGDEPELDTLATHPILSEMDKQGGVATVRENADGEWVKTQLAADLEDLGVTPETHPHIFRDPRKRIKWSARKKGETLPPKGDVEEFDWTESPLVRGQKDESGRPVDKNDIYEGIDDEVSGKPRRTAEETNLILERGIARDELRAELDELGIDLDRTSNRGAVEALHRKQSEAMAPAAPSATPSAAEGGEVPLSARTLDELDELDEMIRIKSETDDEMLVRYFGEDGPKRMKLLERKANSPYDREGADAAQAEIDSMVETLTKEEQDKFFGVGEAGRSLEEMQAIRSEVSATRSWGTADDLAEDLHHHLTDLPEDVTGPLTHSEEIAVAKFNEAARVIEAEGLDSAEVSAKTLSLVSKKYPDLADAEFMLSRFLSKAEPGPRAVEGGVTPPRGEDPSVSRRPGSTSGRADPHPDRPPLTESPGRLEDRPSWELTRGQEAEVHNVPSSLIRALEKFHPELGRGVPKNTPEQIAQLEAAGFAKEGKLTPKGEETLAGRVERFVKFQTAARNGEAVDRGAALDWPLQIARAYRYKKAMKTGGKRKPPGQDAADDLSVDEAKSVSEDILNERRVWDEERGIEMMEEVDELMDRRVKHEVNQRVNKAALDLFEAGQVTRDPNRPLFEQMAELIASRRLSLEDEARILAKYNMDFTDFAAIWGTDVSASGRQLGALGNLQRAINRGRLSKQARMQLESKLRDKGVSAEERADIQKTLDEAGGVLDEESIEVLRGLGIDTDIVKALSTWRRLENIRRGMLVSQIATSMRNQMTQFGNVGMSLMQEQFERAIKGTFNKYGQAKGLVGLDGTAALARAEAIHPIRAMETLLNITGRAFKRGEGFAGRETGEVAARLGWGKGRGQRWKSEGTDWVDNVLSVFPRHRDLLTSSFNADIAQTGFANDALSKVERFTHMLNTFNRFQEHIFRRASFKAELGRQVEVNPIRISSLSKDERLAMKAMRDDADAWGKLPAEEQARITQELVDNGVVYRSIDKLEADGLLGMVTKRQLDAAVNHSLDLTWAKQFDPNAEKYVKGVKQRHASFDRTAGKLIQVVNENPMMSWVTPFPRFMANSFQWQLNHSPYGLINAIVSKRGRDLMAKGDYSELAEGMTGLTMLYASWELAESEYATGKGTELRVPDAVAEAMGLEPGTTIDLRAYAPFLTYYWAAHTIKRHLEDKPPPPFTEIAQVIAGANMRAGMGLYVVDQLIADLASVGKNTAGQGALAKTGEIAGTTFGNIASSYLVKLNELYAGYKQFQQWQGNMEPSKVRDATGPAQPGETGVMPLGHGKPWYESGPSNFWSALLGQVESRTPFGSRERHGIDPSTGKAASAPAYPEVELSTRREAPFSYAPMWKALTGMTFKDPKNMLEKEANKHGLSQSDLVPSSGNKLWDRQVRRQFGHYIEEMKLPLYLSLDAYQDLSEASQLEMLREKLLYARTEAVRRAGNQNEDLRDLVAKQNADYRRRIFEEEGGWTSKAELLRELSDE